jgi:hypothetical protein
MSRFVIPKAYIEMIRSLNSGTRFRYFGMTRGSKVPLRSRGTRSITFRFSKGIYAHSTVFSVCPFRLSPVPGAGVFVVPQMGHLGFQDFLENSAGQLFYQPALTQNFVLGQPPEVYLVQQLVRPAPVSLFLRVSLSCLLLWYSTLFLPFTQTIIHAQAERKPASGRAL